MVKRGLLWVGNPETLKALDRLYEAALGLPLSDPDADAIGKFMNNPPPIAPDTQRLAALRACPRTGTQRRRVLDFIALKGEYGATDEEIQMALRMSGDTQRPRRVELVDGGWVEVSTLTRPTLSENAAAVWTMSEHGLWKWRHP